MIEAFLVGFVVFYAVLFYVSGLAMIYAICIFLEKHDKSQQV